MEPTAQCSKEKQSRTLSIWKFHEEWNNHCCPLTNFVLHYKVVFPIRSFCEVWSLLCYKLQHKCGSLKNRQTWINFKVALIFLFHERATISNNFKKFPYQHFIQRQEKQTWKKSRNYSKILISRKHQTESFKLEI